jgi:hypothetical protein
MKSLKSLARDGNKTQQNNRNTTVVTEIINMQNKQDKPSSKANMSLVSTTFTEDNKVERQPQSLIRIQSETRVSNITTE